MALTSDPEPAFFLVAQRGAEGCLVPALNLQSPPPPPSMVFYLTASCLGTQASENFACVQIAQLCRA